MQTTSNFILILAFSTFYITGKAQIVGAGNALQFDGGTTHIEFGELYNDLELPITVEAWLEIDAAITDNNRRSFFGSSIISGVYSGIWFSFGRQSMRATYGDA